MRSARVGRREVAGPAPARTWARWVLAGVVALTVCVAPVYAGAAGTDDEPSPTSWPTVDKPAGSVNQSDPRPVSRPTVDQPETAQGNDPRPTTWPAPDQQ